jgi:NAD(P)H dehydrogenase (quinone)
MMASIYVPFYSRYGNVEQMAQAVAEGVVAAGGTAQLAYVGDVMTPESVRAADERWAATHARLLAEYPAASTEAVAEADGVAFGAPTRFGVMAAQMKNFFDMMGGLWMAGSCDGKPAGAFTSTATLHGGQEVSNYTMWPVLAHLGFVITGVSYGTQELLTTTTGGGPYGPSHVAGGMGEIPVDETEKAICRALGERLARYAEALKGLR